jgi:hypothetical protein
MSWLFSQALVEEYSEGTSLDGEPCAQLNVMPTPHKFWRNDKTMECSHLSRFGLTLRLLTEGHGAELLMSYLADFHARTSALPEQAQESKATEAGCGRKWEGSFARYDRDSHGWKTPQCSLLGGLIVFSETWPRWGSMRNGECWERTTLALATTGSEYGSLPTPTARDYKDGWVQRYRDGVLQLDTLGRAIGGPVNPEFSELLMAWPIGWTDLKPLAMDRFQEWLQQHSPFSQGDSKYSQDAA